MSVKAALINQEVQAEATNEPIVISMGKKTRRQIRKLRNGKPGRLMNRVEEAIERLRDDGSLEQDAQPVVIVVRQRAKRKGRRAAKFWGLG